MICSICWSVRQPPDLLRSVDLFPRANRSASLDYIICRQNCMSRFRSPNQPDFESWPKKKIRGYREWLLETARELVTIACTRVYMWAHILWPNRYYLIVCIWLQEWAHAGLESTVPMHSQHWLFMPQLFLDIRAMVSPELPLIFLKHRNSPSNLAESRYPRADYCLKRIMSVGFFFSPNQNLPKRPQS